MTRISFQEWLLNKLKEKNMIPAELARRGSISEQSLSKIINGSRNPGVDSLIGIAEGLKISRTEVFRAAGILDETKIDPEIESLAMRISKLPKSQQKVIDAMIDTILAQQENNSELNPGIADG